MFSRILKCYKYCTDEKIFFKATRSNHPGVWEPEVKVWQIWFLLRENMFSDSCVAFGDVWQSLVFLTYDVLLQSLPPNMEFSMCICV